MRKRKMVVFAAAALMAASLSLTVFAAGSENKNESAVQTEQQSGEMEEFLAEVSKMEARRREVSTDDVKEMEILKLPDQTRYYGETIWQYHLDGMKLRLTYEDGETVDIRCDVYTWYDEEDGEYEIDDTYTGAYQEDWSDYEIGEQTVKLSCGSAEIEFPIHIIGITSISLKKAPACTEYWCEIDRRQVDESGIVLDAVFSDGSRGELSYSDYRWTVNGEVHEEIDDPRLTFHEDRKEIQLSLDGKDVVFPITQKRVQSVSVAKLPDRTVYYGDHSENFKFASEGIELKVVLTDGTSEVIHYYHDDEVGYCWRKKDGTRVGTVYTAEYKGNYQEDSYSYAYGTWPVEISLDGKITQYQIEIKDYPRHDCGALTLGNMVECLLEEEHIYEYTFLAKETGLYDYDTMPENNEITISAWCGTEELDTYDRRWLFRAGKTYKIALYAGEVDAGNPKVYFSLKKNIVTEGTIAAGEPKEISFSAGDQAVFYTFVPKASGIYLIYSEGASDDLDPAVELFGAESESYWDRSDDNNQMEGGDGYNFGLRTYLTAGQTYHYLVWARRSDRGTLKVHVKQEEDRCPHRWVSYNQYDSTCQGSGVKKEYCEECNVDKYTEIPRKPHTFGTAAVVKAATVLEEGWKESVCAVCKETVRTAIPKLPPALKLNATSIPLKIKQSTTALKVTEMAKGDAVVSWTSSNPKIVKVTNGGKVTAGKKVGKAVLTVKLKSGKTANVTVKVQKNKVKTKKIKVSEKKITLKKGRSYTLTPVVTPITTQDKTVYSATKKSVATVSKKGVIKAKKPGTVKITVKSGKKKVAVTVKVTK